MTPIRGLLVKGAGDAMDAAAPVINDAADEAAGKARGFFGSLMDKAAGIPGAIWDNKGKAAAGAVLGASALNIYGSPSAPNQKQGAANQNNAAPAAAAPAAANDNAPQYAAPTLMAPAMMRSVARNMRDNTPAQTALPTQSVAQRQQYVDPDSPGNSSTDAFKEALTAAGRAAAGNGFAGVLGAGIAMKLGAMKAGAASSDQSRYQRWVNAINENVARRNTEAMTQAQQNNAMALSNAQLMQGNERLRMDSANAYNSTLAGLANTAAYTDQNAINLANNQFNNAYNPYKDKKAEEVAAATQGRRNRSAGMVLGANPDKLPQTVAAANLINGFSAGSFPGNLYDSMMMAQQGAVPTAVPTAAQAGYYPYGQY
jgi:hypothetical protein